MKKISLSILIVVLSGFVLKAEQSRPNIIWVIVEDMSHNFGYNGETLIQTPHVDKLAEEGVVFERAYVTGPVCSASRSALITGMYQTSIGAHNHRSSNGVVKIYLPDGIKTVPEYFKDAGYYTSNQYIDNNKWTRIGKEDYNFVYERDKMYCGVDWNGRDEGQPFFSQIHLRGGKHRNVELDEMVDPNIAIPPPHYPNDSVFREDWAQYLNAVKNVDLQEKIFFAEQRPAEELYNIALDKYQLVNLATDENMKNVLGEMRTILKEWETSTNDQGKTIESDDVYMKEMQPVMESVRNNPRLPERAKILENNIAIMRQWAAEGK